MTVTGVTGLTMVADCYDKAVKAVVDWILHVMSSLTDVETGSDTLLFEAWQVKMEWRSDLWMFGMTSWLVTLYWVEVVKVSSTRWWSLHQVTLGLGLPPRTWQIHVVWGVPAVSARHQPRRWWWGCRPLCRVPASVWSPRCSRPGSWVSLAGRSRPAGCCSSWWAPQQSPPCTCRPPGPGDWCCPAPVCPGCDLPWRRLGPPEYHRQTSGGHSDSFSLSDERKGDWWQFEIDSKLIPTSSVVSVDWFRRVVLEPEHQPHLVPGLGRGEVAGQLHGAPGHAGHGHRLLWKYKVAHSLCWLAGWLVMEPK